MKVFDGFNTSTKCFICNTNNEGKSVLIPIVAGKLKSREGSIVECEQVHLECLSLEIMSGNDKAIIFQTVDLQKKDDYPLEDWEEADAEARQNQE